MSAPVMSDLRSAVESQPSAYHESKGGLSTCEVPRVDETAHGRIQHGVLTGEVTTLGFAILMAFPSPGHGLMRAVDENSIRNLCLDRTR